jgi:phenylpyruvate tautomerase PptA (4-oxalocrotonate tautomerase family)
MKNSLTICIATFMILIPSCKKDSTDIKVIKTLTIDNESHAFINNDGTRYFKNTLTSQQDSHKYELEMVKGVEYRISASQPNALINQTKLTLVNVVGDTLAESLNEGNSKSSIIVKSPETTNYYLIVNLVKRTNPQFDYRLYFEEIIDDVKSFSGFDWQSNGNWIMTNSNTAELTNSDSRVYRHLKLNSPVIGNPNMSFTIQTNSISSPNFGFILDPSEELIQFSEYAYELPSTGYAFLAFKNDGQYTIMKLNAGSMSLDWGSITNVNLDFSAGIKVELKFELNQYNIYLNGIRLKNINGFLQNIDIVVQDCGDGITKIKDFQFGN